MSIYGIGGAASTSVYSPPATTQQANLTREAPPESSSGNPNDVLSVIMPLMTEMMKAMMQALSSLGQPAEQTPPERASTLNYDDNGSINQRRLQLAEGESPLVQQLMNQAVTVEPESPESQRIQAQLGVLLKDNPDKFKEFSQLTTLTQLNNVKGSLNAAASNLDPNSPEYQQNQQRLQALEVTRQHIIEQLKQGEAEPIVPNLKDNESIGQRLQQLTQDEDPAVQQFLDKLKTISPEDPESQQVKAKIAALWRGDSKELEELMILTDISSLNDMKGFLTTVGSAASSQNPTSPASQQTQARLDAIDAQLEAAIELWKENRGIK